MELDTNNVLVLRWLLLPCVLTTGCSFLATNFDAESAVGRDAFTRANYHARFRGPDATTVRHRSGWTFVHNLLAMTGTFTPQPFVAAGATAVFNGEIYNFRELARELEGDADAYASDGHCLLPAYARWGPAFVEHLRGEFAIVVVDHDRSQAIVSTDVFGTKPLWIAAWDKKLAIATYESSLEGIGAPRGTRRMASPNAAVVYDLATSLRKSTHPVFVFNLWQHKTHTRDWERAFLAAVNERTDRTATKRRWFIGLSSGYDSGAIMLALLLSGKKFLAYSIRGRENTNIVWQRAEKCRTMDCEAVLLQVDNRTLDAERRWLEERIEPYAYRHRDAGLPHSLRLVSHIYKSTAAIGLSRILSLVRRRNGLIYISGSGADETISDYALNGTAMTPGSSCFGGVFPEHLEAIFPWCSFYLGSQRAFLMKEELTGGAHGIETRYPFLDPRVVQEYLWLSRDLKNSEYKKPVADFLRRYNFPNLWGAKRGFAGHKNSVEVAATTTVGSLQSATVWDLHPSLDVAWRKKRRRDQRRRGQLARERAGSIIHAEEATYQKNGA